MINFICKILKIEPSELKKILKDLPGACTNAIHRNGKPF